MLVPMPVRSLPTSQTSLTEMVATLIRLSLPAPGLGLETILQEPQPAADAGAASAHPILISRVTSMVTRTQKKIVILKRFMISPNFMLLDWRLLLSTYSSLFLLRVQKQQSL